MRANQEGLRIALVGAREHEIEKFTSQIKRSYPHLRIVFAANGYFDLDDAITVIKPMLERQADIILVSMGSPRQERFCHLVSEQVRSSQSKITLLTCGAFFYQAAIKGEEFYPGWATRWNLRWVYRLAKERTTFHRILDYYIPFFLRHRVLKTPLFEEE